MQERVCVGKVAGNMDLAVSRLFGEFPDVRRRLEECESVFIKINAVYFYPHLHTSLQLIEAAIEYIRSLDSRKSFFLMENCSQGNFTRLCFSAIGLDALAKKLRVNCLYLDEEKSIQVEMPHGDATETIRFPRILQQKLGEERDRHFYIDMPVLKAHCQAQMTAGIKNQMGLLYDRDKAKHHNAGLHQKLVDILKYIRPDFTLVDALKVLERGPMPPSRFVEARLHEKDVIVGGADVVAVDAVCEKILGYEPGTVGHLALAGEQHLGTIDLKKIEIVGEMPPCSERIPWELETHFPESLRIVLGAEGACYEGCLGHLEQVLELLVNENADPKEFEDLPLTVVTGKGFKPEQLEGLEEPIILLGKCACEEVVETLRAKHIGVDCLNTCGRCDNILGTAARHLNLNVLDLSPLSRLESYRQFLTGKLHGLRFRIPR